MYSQHFPELLSRISTAINQQRYWTASLNQYFATGYRQSFGFAFGFWSMSRNITPPLLMSGLNCLQGFSSPLICQAALARGVPWFKIFLISLILSGLNTVFLVTTFRPTEREFLRDRKVVLTTVMVY